MTGLSLYLPPSLPSFLCPSSEKGTTVEFKEAFNTVTVTAELAFDPDPPVIPLTFNPDPIYIFRLQMTLIGML